MEQVLGSLRPPEICAALGPRCSFRRRARWREVSRLRNSNGKTRATATVRYFSSCAGGNSQLSGSA